MLACRPGTWLLRIDRSSTHGSLQRRLHRARRWHLWSYRLWRSILLLEHGLRLQLLVEGGYMDRWRCGWRPLAAVMLHDAYYALQLLKLVSFRKTLWHRLL